MRLSPGEQIDRYVVERTLGEGGTAVVYLVRHGTLQTRHALKVLSSTSPEVNERLLQEGQIQAALRHEHVVGVSDVLHVGHSIALLMEYVKGPTLSELIEDTELSVDEALTLFRGVCLGVAHAHAEGLIHRDLKPSNVMLAVDKNRLRPMVTDFGLAKAMGANDMRRTRTGATMGTPAFMAPEQISDSSRVDRRADLWSLGCILYALTHGHIPFDDEDVLMLFNKVARAQHRPIDPNLPERVRVSIQALLQVDPAERPADCNELLGYLAEDEDDLYPSTVGIGDLPPATLPPFDPGPTWLPASSRLGLMVAEIVRDNATVEVHRSTMGTAGMLFGSSPDLAAPPPPESSRRGAVLPLLAGAALLGAVALGVWVGQSRQAPVVGAPVAPAPARTESQPVVDPPVHELAPAPAPAPAELVEPEPVVEAPPTPQPVRVAPAPVAPRPVPPEPPPAATSTAVTFEGADEMWLSDSGGARHQGSVGPGEYRILAKFPGSDEEVSAGIVEVTDQDALHVVCNGMMRRCAAH